MSSSASVAARVAGAIGALGYLTGIVDGPFVGALAGLALVTFGRGLIGPTGSELIGPACFAVLAGAAGAAALRWGSLDLHEIQGAQGVLGPTIAVEPTSVAGMSVGALIAATVALGIWSGARPRDAAMARWWWVELATGSLLLGTLFCGPPPTDVVQGALWIGATIAIGAMAILVGGLAEGLSVRTKIVTVAACGAVVGVAAVVAGSLS